VRAMAVVVRGVLVQDRAQVPWPGDQHPVGDLGTGCSHQALGISIRSERPRRGLHHSYALAGQDIVERGRELRVAVPDEEPELGSCANFVMGHAG
jgi:hypothetical protein